MQEIKQTRNRKKKYSKSYVFRSSDEELKKINDFKEKSGWPISKIVREHLLIGGLMENEEYLIKNISILRRSEELVYKNQIGFQYTKTMEERLKELEERTGAYKTSLIRTFLQNSKLI
jgi:predicted DNA-binding protein